jgi:hypothetical protein
VEHKQPMNGHHENLDQIEKFWVIGLLCCAEHNMKRKNFYFERNSPSFCGKLFHTIQQNDKLEAWGLKNGKHIESSCIWMKERSLNLAKRKRILEIGILKINILLKRNSTIVIKSTSS